LFATKTKARIAIEWALLQTFIRRIYASWGWGAGESSWGR